MKDGIIEGLAVNGTKYVSGQPQVGRSTPKNGDEPGWGGMCHHRGRLFNLQSW
jgi:hypothetical protein